LFFLAVSDSSRTCLTASSLNSGENRCVLIDFLLCSNHRPGMSTGSRAVQVQYADAALLQTVALVGTGITLDHTVLSGATLASAWRYRQGRGGQWKGRAQAIRQPSHLR
jgi:hypothetical protein